MILLIAADIITRYVMIFYLENHAAFLDEFWSVFVNIWLLGCILLSNGTYHILMDKIERKPYYFYICVRDSSAETASCIPSSGHPIPSQRPILS